MQSTSSRARHSSSIFAPLINVAIVLASRFLSNLGFFRIETMLRRGEKTEKATAGLLAPPMALWILSEQGL